MRERRGSRGVAARPHRRHCPTSGRTSVEELRRSATRERLDAPRVSRRRARGQRAGGHGDTGERLRDPARPARAPAPRRRHRAAVRARRARRVVSVSPTSVAPPTTRARSPSPSASASRRSGARSSRCARSPPASPGPPCRTASTLISLAERPELLARLYQELALAGVRGHADAAQGRDHPRAVGVGVDHVAGGDLRRARRRRARRHGRAPPRRRSARARRERAHDRPPRLPRPRASPASLKETTIAWASDRGLREIYTWTQTGNENMRAVNERLGYVTRTVSINLRRKLPL